MLTACAGSPVSSLTLPPCFAANTDVAAGDTVYSMYLSRFADGYWQVELTAPAAVKGLIFTVSGENTDVSFDGLKFTFDTARFPVGSVVSAAIDALDRLYASPLEVVVGEEQNIATGTVGESGYTLTLSKTNLPQKLELPDSGITLTFNTFDVIEVTE